MARNIFVRKNVDIYDCPASSLSPYSNIPWLSLGKTKTDSSGNAIAGTPSFPSLVMHDNILINLSGAPTVVPNWCRSVYFLAIGAGGGGSGKAFYWTGAHQNNVWTDGYAGAVGNVQSGKMKVGTDILIGDVITAKIGLGGLKTDDAGGGVLPKTSVAGGNGGETRILINSLLAFLAPGGVGGVAAAAISNLHHHVGSWSPDVPDTILGGFTILGGKSSKPVKFDSNGDVASGGTTPSSGSGVGGYGGVSTTAFGDGGYAASSGRDGNAWAIFSQKD